MSPETIREALEWYDEMFSELDGLGTAGPRRLRYLAEAARAYATLLENAMELASFPQPSYNGRVLYVKDPGRYLVVRVGEESP